MTRVFRVRLFVRDSEFDDLAGMPALERFAESCDLALGFSLRDVQTAEVEQS
jgi:hypothetical protein